MYPPAVADHRFWCHAVRENPRHKVAGDGMKMFPNPMVDLGFESHVMGGKWRQLQLQHKSVRSSCTSSAESTTHGFGRICGVRQLVRQRKSVRPIAAVRQP